MSRTFKKAASADEIADMASRGEDVSAYFTNKTQLARALAEERAIGSRRRKTG
jgi:hypothetical protein